MPNIYILLLVWRTPAATQAEAGGAPGEALPQAVADVLDCAEAPADMRGHALYLQDHNGGPHVAPQPHAKFHSHWRPKHGERVTIFILPN